MSERRDVAVVLSGGGMNGLLMEVGFLRRLRETTLWPRIGWYFGTSAGAVSGSMAALDRLDQLEDFLFRLRPEETFRPNRLWRLPLLGTHDYVLPQTVAERLGDPTEIARELAAAVPELVVVVTDVTSTSEDGAGSRLFELAYSSKTTEPAEMGRAVLASAAISAFVLPMAVGDRVGTDGGWVRNFPLGYAYERPGVERIVAFRYVPKYPTFAAGALAAAARRLRRYSRLPPARALVAELEQAAEREARGEPAHVIDTFARLTRVAVLRNTALEELNADYRDQSIRELRSLREDIGGLVRDGSDERERLAAEIERRFKEAKFPFGHDRIIPRITVAGSVGEVSLDPGFRKPKPWTVEAKRALMDRGYELAAAEFRASGIE